MSQQSRKLRSKLNRLRAIEANPPADWTMEQSGWLSIEIADVESQLGWYRPTTESVTDYINGLFR